ncbi:hypothetical protein [Ruminococcoides intestinale]|uniref:hypothetical protein n=1 Tax=Ruminococcoides intestinale TaxID=3133162 RepID=UPI0032D2BADC
MEKKFINSEKVRKRCNLIFTTVKGLKRSQQKVTSSKENDLNFTQQEDKNVNLEGDFNE